MKIYNSHKQKEKGRKITAIVTAQKKSTARSRKKNSRLCAESQDSGCLSASAQQLPKKLWSPGKGTTAL
jgi:hypothetical protein